MRIAHLSDPHILDLEGVERSRLLWNKRLTGMVNIKLHRGSVHKRHVVEAMMEDLRERRVDHVVITGDITNLALETEFERARAVFADLGLDAEHVSVIPGNHDVYTRGAEIDQRFAKYFAEHITSDLPFNDAGNHPSGPFPFVRLRGDVAIIGLSTAVARLPLIASGRAGARQLEALGAILEHPEVATRTPVVLIHHPLINPPGYIGTATHGLPEAKRIREILSRRKESVVLHGHLHDRAHRVVEFELGAVMHHFGATSASLLHQSPDRMAGYNVYDIGPNGLESASARVYDPSNGVFVDSSVRKRSASYAT
jgi:3',5'-cyclic AMP phosphodiesterase CpdA